MAAMPYFSAQAGAIGIAVEVDRHEVRDAFRNSGRVKTFFLRL